MRTFGLREAHPIQAGRLAHAHRAAKEDPFRAKCVDFELERPL